MVRNIRKLGAETLRLLHAAGSYQHRLTSFVDAPHFGRNSLLFLMLGGKYPVWQVDADVGTVRRNHLHFERVDGMKLVCLSRCRPGHATDLG